MLPWKLFDLTPRDQSQPVMRLWHKRTTSQVVAAAQIDVSWAVPAEQVAVVTGWGIRAVAGAGQQCNEMQLHVLDESGLIVNQQQLTLYPAGVTIGQTILAFFLVPPGYTVRERAIFNAGANPNYFDATLQATLIPRGTIQVV